MESYKKLIEEVRRGIPVTSRGLFALEEYILLPEYGGNIMLRFGLGRAVTDASELDSLETELYGLVPQGFLVDFMSDVYRSAGFGYGDLEKKLLRCAEKYRDAVVPDSPFRGEVLEETARVLALCQMAPDSRVWEIQPDAEETALLILGGENAKIKEVTAKGMKYEVISVREAPCEGIMKAAVSARERGVSLMRAVEEASSGD